MGSILDKVTKEQLSVAVQDSYNLTDAMLKIGYVKPRANNYACFKRKCGEYGIDIQHLAESTKTPLSIKRYTDKEVFCEGSSISQTCLRDRYLKGNFSDYHCSLCGINTWQDKPLTLRLDHINGNRTDNRLENLRWVCPNCDSQLETYCNNSSNRQIYYCCDCGAVINSAKATRCESCAKIASRKVERPNRETLKQMIRSRSFVDIGREFNVSDNAIRKWCKAENLPFKTTDIKTYSDDEWFLI